MAVLNLTHVHPHLCSARGLAPSPSCKTQPHHYRSLFSLLTFHPLASQNHRHVPFRSSSTLLTNTPLHHRHHCSACGLDRRPSHNQDPLLPPSFTHLSLSSIIHATHHRRDIPRQMKNTLSLFTHPSNHPPPITTSIW